MKRKKLIFTLFVVVMVSAGCEALVGSFSASINGNYWESTTTITVKSDTTYTINAQNGNTTIFMTIDGTSTGVYNVDPLDSTYQVLVYTPDIGMASNSYAATRGNINLSKITSNRLSGTFDIYAKNVNDPLDSIPITGQFSNLLTN